MAAYGLTALLIAVVAIGVFYTRFYSRKSVEQRRRSKERERRKVRSDEEA